jgi:hypothetical protein
MVAFVDSFSTHLERTGRARAVRLWYCLDEALTIEVFGERNIRAAP